MSASSSGNQSSSCYEENTDLLYVFMNTITPLVKNCSIILGPFWNIFDAIGDLQQSHHYYYKKDNKKQAAVAGFSGSQLLICTGVSIFYQFSKVAAQHVIGAAFGGFGFAVAMGCAAINEQINLNHLIKQKNNPSNQTGIQQLENEIKRSKKLRNAWIGCFVAMTSIAVVSCFCPAIPAIVATASVLGIISGGYRLWAKGRLKPFIKELSGFFKKNNDIRTKLCSL